MKMRTTSLVVLALLLLFAVVACEREPAPLETTERITEPTATATPGGATPTQAMIWIDDPTLGSQLAPDGSIMTGYTDNDFEPGDTIYYAMEVGDAPSGAMVRVVWYGPNNQLLHEETKPVTPGQTYLNFQAPDTAQWPVGDYRAEIWTEGAKAHEEDFNIEAPGNVG